MQTTSLSRCQDTDVLGCCLFHHRLGSCCARGEQRIVRLGTVPVSIPKIWPAFEPFQATRQM